MADRDPRRRAEGEEDHREDDEETGTQRLILRPGGDPRPARQKGGEGAYPQRGGTVEILRPDVGDGKRQRQREGQSQKDGQEVGAFPHLGQRQQPVMLHHQRGKERHGRDQQVRQKKDDAFLPPRQCE